MVSFNLQHRLADHTVVEAEHTVVDPVGDTVIDPAGDITVDLAWGIRTQHCSPLEVIRKHRILNRPSSFNLNNYTIRIK
jgi:hypothetical protein